MNAWAAFFLGLLSGWVIEWIIDWLYLRRRQPARQAEPLQIKPERVTTGPVRGDLERQLEALKLEFTSLLQHNAGLEADKAALTQQLSALTMEKTSLAGLLATCQTALSAGKPSPVVEAPAVPAVTAEAPTMPADALTVRAVPLAPVERDDLEIIKGIGPLINLRLNQAGIYTFKQLAAITPARLVEIAGDVIRRLADEDSIIAQAKELAAKRENGG